MTFADVVDGVGTVVDGAGVAVIVVGALSALAVTVRAGFAREPGIYPLFRRHLGRSILLGLELLVAADIIRTVAVTPTLASVAVLAVIVIIRTFLSFSLELEITGRWPWQRDPRSTADPTRPDPTRPRADRCHSGKSRQLRMSWRVYWRLPLTGHPATAALSAP